MRTSSPKISPSPTPDPASARLPKIVLVTGSLEAGGAERVMADLANYWGSRGWQIVVATWSCADIRDFYKLDNRVRREWLDVYSPNNSLIGKIRSTLHRVSKLRRLLRREKPDAVLSFIDVPNMLTLMATAGLGLRVVVSERGCPDPVPSASNAAWAYTLSRHWKILRRVLYRRAATVTALNHESARWIESECGVPVRVIPVAVRELAEVQVDRELMVLAVGRLHAVKGFDVLLKAFAKVRDSFPSWNLTIIGAGPEGPALVRLSAELGISSRVTFLDPVQDVETWMARASLVVLPSRSEAFGNAVLESMAMGTPVVATRCAGPTSLIEDGKNGRLVPVGDVHSLSVAMSELMARPALRAQLGSQATLVRKTYEQTVIMRQWEDCLIPRRLSHTTGVLKNE
ncbi:MAG: glycosyltransferase family 4 protein [Betaproteobacteria bacterium]